MYNGKRIIAVIPARAGSKGIKDKNIRELCRKPLIAYSIEVAKACDYIDTVFVSTDSVRIQEIAKQYGAEVPFLRSEELASDEAKIIDALLFSLKRLELMNQKYDYIMLLQPTQPIRTVELLKAVIEQTIDRHLPSMVTICPVEEHPILMRTIEENGRLHSLLESSSTVRRQDFPPFYKVNGSVYINRIDEFFNEHTSLNDNRYGYLMKRRDSVDIDTLEDFERAEKILKDNFERNHF